ncbi:MAG TPA: PilZ domain-containing protein [Bdellovibrionota bacterium]|jgi:CheY-like chemotaxis protein
MGILQGKLIVVAAGDESLRETVAAEFRNAGCHVLPTGSAVHAYELARERTVDGVITAGKLLGGNPLQLLADIRTLSYETPVILFAADGEKISHTEALHRGFSAFFLNAPPANTLSNALVRGLEIVDERKRKKVERVTVAAFVDLLMDKQPTVTNAPVMNLSRGGMFLSMESGFPAEQTIVDFKLRMPQTGDQPVLQGRAFVRWVRERGGSGHLAGVGLEFRDLSNEACEFIDRYVDRMSARR